MIRITSAVQGSETVIALAGRLEERHLEELEAYCTAPRGTVAFDLSELRSADEAAICWLRSRKAMGDRVTGASPYIGFRIEHEPTSPTA